MATVDGLTKARMLQIEAASVVGGTVTSDHLILTKHDGSTIDAGSVRGEKGDPGPTGGIGPTGVAGNIAVAAATTTTSPLSGLTITDGYSPVAGDLILVKNQAAASANGIYVAAAGAWARWASASVPAQIATLGVVQVKQGAVNGGTQWATSFRADGTVGTTNMVWGRVLSELSAVQKNYTPALTGVGSNPSGWSVNGLYWQIGNQVFYEIALTVATGTTPGAGSGNYLVTLPVASANTLNDPVGSATAYAGSGSYPKTCIPIIVNSTQIVLLRCATDTALDNTGPGIAWGSEAFIRISGKYRT